MRNALQANHSRIALSSLDLAYVGPVQPSPGAKVFLAQPERLSVSSNSGSDERGDIQLAILDAAVPCQLRTRRPQDSHGL